MQRRRTPLTGPVGWRFFYCFEIPRTPNLAIIGKIEKPTASQDQPPARQRSNAPIVHWVDGVDHRHLGYRLASRRPVLVADLRRAAPSPNGVPHTARSTQPSQITRAFELG